MFWAAGKEEKMYRAFSSDPYTECSYYPDKCKYIIINNSTEKRTTVFTNERGEMKEIELQGGAYHIET